MEKIKVNGKFGEFELNLPQSLAEVPSDYFKACTEFANPAPNYVIVAIAYRSKMALILNAGKKNQPAAVNVTPIFVKAGEIDSEFINSIKCGEKIVVAASDLSLGHHLNCPMNKINPNYITRIFDGNKYDYNVFADQNEYIFVDFKIVPAHVIHAKLNNESEHNVCPFVTDKRVVGDA